MPITHLTCGECFQPKNCCVCKDRANPVPSDSNQPSMESYKREKRTKENMRFETTEIERDEQRELAAKALTELWDAMKLSYPPIGRSREKQESYRRAYDKIAKMILGKDAPEKETLC